MKYTGPLRLRPRGDVKGTHLNKGRVLMAALQNKMELGGQLQGKHRTTIDGVDYEVILRPGYQEMRVSVPTSIPRPTIPQPPVPASPFDREFVRAEKDRFIPEYLPEEDDGVFAGPSSLLCMYIDEINAIDINNQSPNFWQSFVDIDDQLACQQVAKDGKEYIAPKMQGLQGVDYVYSDCRTGPNSPSDRVGPTTMINRILDERRDEGKEYTDVYVVVNADFLWPSVEWAVENNIKKYYNNERFGYGPAEYNSNDNTEVSQSLYARVAEWADAGLLYEITNAGTTYDINDAYADVDISGLRSELFRLLNDMFREASAYSNSVKAQLSSRV